jgi:hypothetical protein
MNKQMELEGRSTDIVRTFDTDEEIIEYFKKTL